MSIVISSLVNSLVSVRMERHCGTRDNNGGHDYAIRKSVVINNYFHCYSVVYFKKASASCQIKVINFPLLKLLSW